MNTSLNIAQRASLVHNDRERAQTHAGDIMQITRIKDEVDGVSIITKLYLLHTYEAAPELAAWSHDDSLTGAPLYGEYLRTIEDHGDYVLDPGQVPYVLGVAGIDSWATR